ncbi:diaminopropionate ammonia-lyase [Undibacterium sp. TJN25]|uniref:diaminopropionate ammonia-lyase n=1 Tax=Undibacterium sp. TJN25 TaxID=3413056 RepID=UPI003BF1B8DD
MSSTTPEDPTMNPSIPVIMPPINSTLFTNPRCASADTAYSDAMREVLSLASFADAQRHISQWAGYHATPLASLPGLAEAVGLGRIHYKDESGRFGLGSFKALGGAYAVGRLLQKEVARLAGHEIAADELGRPEYAGLIRGITVSCATDGNHGRSVALGAQRYGCGCIIYVHAGVSAGRVAAIEAYGAQVVRIAGNYDDSVRQAAADSARYAHFVVSDTSYPGYLDVPRDVMQGYTVMVDEILQQMGPKMGPDPQHLPTHIFVQGGVGGLAAAVCAHCWESLGSRRPRLVVVEPERAACLYHSAVAGHPVVIDGELDTVMAGLACGEISPLAWRILEQGASAFQTIDDRSALFAMKMLADGGLGDPPIVAGESAVAGLVGAVAAAQDATWREQLGLDGTSSVLVIGSEGDTDPGLYQRIVGRAAGAVRQQAEEHAAIAMTRP